MSRLVDADKLIEDILNSMPTGSARGVFRAFIEEQPTAFDVDKVDKQLRERLLENVNKANDEMLTNGSTRNHMFYFGNVEAFNKAIEIVKAGGMNE